MQDDYLWEKIYGIIQKKREVTIMEIYLDNVATTKMDNEVALNLNRLT